MGTVTITTDEHVVNTGRSATAIELPLSDALIGTRLKSGRPSVHIADSTGDVTVRFAYWTSDDGVTWSSVKTLTGYGEVSAAGWHYGSGSFVTMDQAPYVRFGLLVRNSSGNKTDYARLTIALEAKF